MTWHLNSHKRKIVNFVLKSYHWSPVPKSGGLFKHPLGLNGWLRMDCSEFFLDGPGLDDGEFASDERLLVEKSGPTWRMREDKI